MSDSSVSFRGLVSRVVNPSPTPDGKELRTEEVEQLLKGFANVQSDRTELAWLKAEHPDLHQFLTGQGVELKLMRGLRDPEALKSMAQDLERSMNDNRAAQAWSELGLSPAYEARARQFYKDDAWRFIQPLPNASGTMEPRFVMPESSYRELAVSPSERGVVDRLTNWDLQDDLAERLTALGVPADEVYVGVEHRKGQLGMTRDDFHIRPEDAALLLDAHTLEQRGSELCEACREDDFQLVRRMTLAGEFEPRNVFVMPAHDFLGMRGIAYDMPDNPSEEEILTRCLQRLEQRGVESPRAELTEVDGHVVVALPADQARILLAPMASGDPAGKISLVPMTGHAPDAQGYNPENGVLLIQAANVAYFEADRVEEYTTAWGFKDTQFIENQGTSAQAFTTYDEERNAVIVGFRGSQEMGDALENANFLGTAAGVYGRGEVHHGFKNQLDSILDDLLAAIKPHVEKDPPAKLMLGGHSLGGALAGLFAAYCVRKGIPVAQVYTTGQPSIGNSDFTDDVAKRLEDAGAQYFRYVNNSDVVPHMPPQWSHGELGHTLYFDRFGELQPPEKEGSWDRFWDRARSTTLNLVTGRTFTRGPDSIADHDWEVYLGLARKNRELDFPDTAFGRVRRMVETAQDAVGDIVDAAGDAVNQVVGTVADAVENHDDHAGISGSEDSENKLD